MSFSEHLGKYRKGQTPSRTYNGLLSLCVGCDVYKDFRKKTLEEEVPTAFADVCVSAACLAKDRRDALEALVGAKARHAERQAAIAAENERRKAFNKEADRYRDALRKTVSVNIGPCRASRRSSRVCRAPYRPSTSGAGRPSCTRG